MSSKIKIPQKLPCLHVTDGIIFPGASHKIPVRAQINVNMIDDCLMDIPSLRSHVICIVYKEPNNKAGHHGLHDIATAAVVSQVVGSNWPRPSYTMQVTGLCRVKIEEILQNKPYSIVSIRQLSTEMKEIDFESSTTAKKFRESLASFLSVIQSSNVSVVKLKNVLSTAPLELVVDLTASVVEASYETKLTILDGLDLKIRLEMVEKLLKKQTEKLEKLNDDKEAFTVDLYPETIRSDELLKILNNFRNMPDLPGNRKLGALKDDNEREQKPGDILAKKLRLDKF